MIIDSSNLSQYVNSNSSQKSNKNTKTVFRSNTEQTDVFDTIKKFDKSFSQDAIDRFRRGITKKISLFDISFDKFKTIDLEKIIIDLKSKPAKNEQSTEPDIQDTMSEEQTKKLTFENIVQELDITDEQKKILLSKFEKSEEYLDEKQSIDFFKIILLKYIATKSALTKLDLSDNKKYVDNIKEFMKIEYSNKFYEILQNRELKDIGQIIPILTEKLKNCKNEEEAEDLKTTVEELLSAKLPNGNYIFTNENEFGLVDGIGNILSAKENDKEKYDKLMTYVQLTKEGKLPERIMGELYKKSEIVPEVEEAINNKAEIKTYENEEQALNDTKFGNVVEIKGKLYYRKKTDFEQLKIDKKMFEKLFSNLDNLAISQGNLGNCYFVSAIYDLINNPNTKGKIYSLFEQKGDDIVVTIPDSKENPVIFKNAEITETDNKHLLGSLGLRMIEQAYNKTRQDLYSNKNGGFSIEGGCQAQVYNLFLGSQKTNIYTQDNNFYKYFAEYDIDKEISELKKKILLTKEKLNKEKMFWGTELSLSSLKSQYSTFRFLNEIKKSLAEYKNSIHKIEEQDMKELLKSIPNDKNHIISAGTKCIWAKPDEDRQITYGHAYSIYNIDKDNEQVYVINPRNTAQYVKLSFDEFAEYFGTINVLDLSNLE